MNIDPMWVLPVLTLAASAGGAKVALNGTKERVKAMAEKLEQHVKSDNEVQSKLLEAAARIETKLEERTRYVG